jgi:(2Fe-2S) ferredoxin
MPPPFQRHIFVCLNRRPDGSPRGCCASKGAEEILELFKLEIHKRGLKTDVRANGAGCLDACERGVTIVIYPEAVWYGGVTKADVPEIIEQHLVEGHVVERLLMRPIERR